MKTTRRGGRRGRSDGVWRQENRCGYPWDYSQCGAYFITVCTKGRENLFRRGAHCAPAARFPELTEIGTITERTILEIPAHYTNVTVDRYVVMPNHIHMILMLKDDGRTMCAPTPPVSQIIRMLKETVTKRAGAPIWQRSFYDHIIRDESDYLRIWDYIATNPAQWTEDEYYEEANP